MELFEIKVTLGLDTKKHKSVNYTLEEIEAAIKQEKLKEAIGIGQRFEETIKVVNEICKEI